MSASFANCRKAMRPDLTRHTHIASDRRNLEGLLKMLKASDTEKQQALGMYEALLQQQSHGPARGARTNE